MWLGRLLFFIAILALLPLLRRILIGFFSGLLGGAQPGGPQQPGGRRRPRARCLRCGGSGWIAAPAGMKKACNCGIVPPEARGPIIDVGPDRRTDGS